MNQSLHVNKILKRLVCTSESEKCWCLQKVLFCVRTSLMFWRGPTVARLPWEAQIVKQPKVVIHVQSSRPHLLPMPLCPILGLTLCGQCRYCCCPAKTSRTSKPTGKKPHKGSYTFTLEFSPSFCLGTVSYSPLLPWSSSCLFVFIFFVLPQPSSTSI